MSLLVSLFRDKLIPWAQHDLENRLIVARPVIKKSSVPYGVELSRKKIPGKRVLVRTHDNGPQKVIRARWPEAGLHEQYIPKLVCVTKGITDYQAGEYLITCGEGHFIVLPPQTPNTAGGRSHLEGERRSFGSCDLLQLLLFQDYIRCAFCTSRGEEHEMKITGTSLSPQAHYLLSLFMEEAKAPQQNDSQLCSQLLSSAFTFLFREIQSGHLVDQNRPSAKSTSNDNSMQRILDYVMTHLHQSPTIEKAAQAMYMSPSQFTRYIRRETGQSFVDILTECRIEESKHLLRETNWSVAAVARHVGFKSSTYFITFFGKHAGCSPAQYRNKLKMTGNNSCLPDNGVMAGH